MSEEFVIEEEELGGQGLGIVEEDEGEDIPEEVERPFQRYRQSTCPKSDGGHNPIPNPKKKNSDPLSASRLLPDYVCSHCGKSRWTNLELEEIITNKLLREDSNRELCVQCLSEDEDSLPYGEETGHIEWMPQFTKAGEPELDDEGSLLYVAYPELECEVGHRWYLGEGQRRELKRRNPILFETHLYNRRRRELLAKEGVVDPAYTMDRWGKRPTVGLYGRCVDDQTEALTPFGWRTYSRLSIGDLIWSYNIEDDVCEWQPVQELFAYEFTGFLQSLESQNLSARVTEGHRWAVAHEKDKNLRYTVVSQIEKACMRRRDPVTGRMLPRETPISILDPRHYIPTMRSPRIRGDESRLELFELLGWTLTDGTYRKDKNDAIVYQAMHNPKLPHLYRCLEANRLPTEPLFVDQNNVGRWSIPVCVGRPLRELTNNSKLFSSLPLDQYSTAQYEAIFRGARFGDGYRRYEGVTGEIITTNPKEVGAIQGLVTRIGHPSRSIDVSHPGNLTTFKASINCKQSQWAYVRPALQDPEWYEGVVWCPSVENGFWAARRNGKVYITGNSHPLGRRVNSRKKRKDSGSGFYV